MVEFLTSAQCENLLIVVKPRQLRRRAGGRAGDGEVWLCVAAAGGGSAAAELARVRRHTPRLPYHRFSSHRLPVRVTYTYTYLHDLIDLYTQLFSLFVPLDRCFVRNNSPHKVWRHILSQEINDEKVNEDLVKGSGEATNMLMSKGDSEKEDVCVWRRDCLEQYKNCCLFVSVVHRSTSTSARFHFSKLILA